jgi:hypothetical protein
MFDLYTEWGFANAFALSFTTIHAHVNTFEIRDFYCTLVSILCCYLLPLAVYHSELESLKEVVEY